MMLGIVSIVFLNLFAEASGWCLETLGEYIRRLRGLVVAGGAAPSDGPPQFVLTELPPCTLLDSGESMVALQA